MIKFDDAVRIAVAHQPREDECGDHYTKSCSCGAPDTSGLEYSHEMEVRHAFDWDAHVAEKLREATDG